MVFSSSLLQPLPMYLTLDVVLAMIAGVVGAMPIVPAVQGWVAGKDESDAPIWCKNDTHWNGLGAYYGYEAIIGDLGEVFPALVPSALSQFQRTASAPGESGSGKPTGI